MKPYFFNESLKLFENHKLKDKKIVLAVSGGLDSVVLLDLLKELSFPCRLKLSVLHIHHGLSPKKKIKTYRDETKQFVFQLSSSYELDFFSPEPPKEILQSEEDFRKFRHFCFKKILRQKQASLALGHNRDDLLETRLIKLVRGCGEEGLKGMKIWEPPYFRPLLHFSRKEIQKYALYRKLKWKEDPSNKDNNYLRNWMRNKWLPQLDNKRSGSLKSLARSLESISFVQKKNLHPSMITSRGIKRNLLMEMPLKEQKRVLAFYMRKLQLSNYGQSHIGEVLKQAERKEKKFSVKILKKTWTFTQGYIVAE